MQHLKNSEIINTKRNHIHKDKSAIRNISEEKRLTHQLPKGLKIKKSIIPNAGYGVFATETFHIGRKFGPFEGKKVSPDTLVNNIDTSYMWEIIKDGNVLHCIDGKDKRFGNWMRFINCARVETEQNLMAVQYYGEIYYNVYKQIDKGTELLVWYGDQYAKDLGIEVDSTKVNHVCKNCGICFTSDDYLNSHLRRCKKGTIIDNLKVSSNIFNLNNGFFTTDNTNQAFSCGISDEPFKCKYCDYKFARKTNLTIHELTHNGEEPLKCRFCDYTCAWKTRLTLHERTHTGEKPFKCTYCDYRSAWKTRLMIHERTHTGEKPFKCTNCDYKCASKCQLTSHEQIHTGKKPFKCTYCDHQFAKKTTLKLHERTHTGDKPFKCSFCDYQSIQNRRIKLHKRIHTGEKPFKCFFCEFICAPKKNLQYHEQTHTGVRPYQCSLCNYKTIKKTHLVRHIRTHTGEKPFKCPYCDYECIENSRLKKHVLTHTGEKPYNCAYCKIGYSVKKRLKLHELTEHTDKISTAEAELKST
ncbi:histone-lysine N-methyltransferase PRDM9 isoform X2 [Hydra vulgaris]|uniref:Histone-lysine N-methyltransferase PRDM9 isoform X2 n=1 Tax=Hydra vulgaris TaxID=6087 RepID=A0ABM4DEK3_HYDVU